MSAPIQSGSTIPATLPDDQSVRGRSEPQTSANSSSRSNSRVRDALHKLGHMGPGYDWGSHAARHSPSVSNEGTPAGSRSASPARRADANEQSSRSSSRSTSRVRELVHKVVNLGAPTDWAANSMANAEIRSPPTSRGVSPAASRSPSPTRQTRVDYGNPFPARSSSRSSSRVRDILHKATHLSSGSDWAAHSLGTQTEAKVTAAVPAEPIVVAPREETVVV
ncbi:hypothetical protein T439DRAFT_382128 [Meredithblackwellia eburnea MCA 4105]